MKTKYSLGLAFAFLMSCQIWYGCKVSKDVALPDMHLPASFRDTQGSNDTTTIAVISWQNFFQDGELKNLINEALAHNNDLAIAIRNIEAARLVFRQARLGNIPTVDISSTVAANRPSDNSLNGLSLSQELHTKHIEDYTLGASISWEADIWGKIRSRKAATLAAYLSTQEARRALQTEIVSDVAKGYYNLLMLDAQVAIARQNVALLDSTLTITRLQYEAGQVTSLAVQQVDAQRLTAAILIPQFEQQAAIEENAISVLTGGLPASVNRSLQLNNIVFPDKLSAGLPAALLSNRPDVKQSAMELSEANGNVGYAKANLYPSFSITAQAGLDALKTSNWFTIPASLFGAVTGSLVQPLFQQKKLSTQYHIAMVNRDQTVIRFRQSVLVAVEEVSDALVKIDKLKEQRALATERTSELVRATKNSQLLFKNGMANYLEVITAESSVLTSKLEAASITNAQLDATVGWN
jgi:multidrug efflux system outer membrane protein